VQCNEFSLFASSTMSIRNMQCIFLSTNLHSNAVHCLRICYANVLPYLIHQRIEMQFLADDRKRHLVTLTYKVYTFSGTKWS